MVWSFWVEVGSYDNDYDSDLASTSVTPLISRVDSARCPHPPSLAHVHPSQSCVLGRRERPLLIEEEHSLVKGIEVLPCYKLQTSSQNKGTNFIIILELLRKLHCISFVLFSIRKEKTLLSLYQCSEKINSMKLNS